MVCYRGANPIAPYEKGRRNYAMSSIPDLLLETGSTEAIAHLQLPQNVFSR